VDEAEGGAVDAVTQSRRGGAVREHVPQVAVAVSAADLGALHKELVVLAFDEVLLLERADEARPARLVS